MCDKLHSVQKSAMTSTFVQMEVSSTIGRLHVGKMTIDGHSCMLHVELLV